MNRYVILSLVGTLSAGALSMTGCVEHHHREPVEVREVVVEPAPVERVYIVDRGYPPGAYRYHNMVWFEGRSYRPEVFQEKVVTVNVRENRYVNVNENRNLVERVKVEHQREFESRRPEERRRDEDHR